VAKTKKRMSKKELRAPDRFEESLDRAWKRVEPHGKTIAIALVLALVVAVGLAIVGWMRGEAKQEIANAQRVALAPMTVPIVTPEDAPAADPEQPRPAPRGEIYASRKDALEAAQDRLAKFLSASGDADGVAAMKFAEAITKIPLGKAADAATALEAWLAANPDTPLTTSALDHLALAQVAAGQLDKARATYAKLAEQASGLGRAMALTALGDLSNPLIVTGGDPAAARTHYEAAKKALGPKPEAGADLIAMVIEQPYLYAELDTKLAALP
jgi:predicted negative regulator of RcsB-dependent stress response